MEQSNVESVEGNPRKKSNDFTENILPEDVALAGELQPSQAQDIKTEVENVPVDPVKIESAVTEIPIDIINITVNNDGVMPDSSNRDCDTIVQSSFKVDEHLLEVVASEQSDSSNINTEIIEQEETLDDSSIKETVLVDVTKSVDSQDLEDTNVSAEAGNDTDQLDENVDYIEENVMAEETCDPSAMGVIEEIVMTSKSAYSVEIQEQDSTDSRENFVTKDLVMLEVVSENEDIINVVEEHIEEIEIEQTDDCDDDLSQTDVEDNRQSSEEVEIKTDIATVVENEDLKEVSVGDYAKENYKNEDKSTKHKANEMKLQKPSENHRSVIQEIVDDWIDDNIDDVCESKDNVNDSHDSVEIELKTLLADDKPKIKEKKVTKDAYKVAIKVIDKSPTKEKVGRILPKSRNSREFTIKERVNGYENKAKASKNIATTGETLSPKTTRRISSQLHSKSLTSGVQETIDCKRTVQSARLATKAPIRHLMSQIASKAEVTEVLKERIKQKQQDIELPQGGDILFVKKITQRLSSKLSGASAQDFPLAKSSPQIMSMSSEDQSNNSTDDKTIDSAGKIETADNTELLAILEGDVDPDWSNLKPHMENEACESAEVPPDSNMTPKLDPLTERELALKQLLELPTIAMKKHIAKRRRTFKPAPSKVSTKINVSSRKSDGKQSASTVDAPAAQTLSADEDDPIPKVDTMVEPEEIEINPEDSHIEESRSGRKRKPTEKAREHEQNLTKKQKVYKGKIAEQRKIPKIEALTDESSQESQEAPPLNVYLKESDSVPMDSKTTGRNVLSKISITKNRIYHPKSSKIDAKLAQNIVKRNLPVKKLLDQKSSGNITNSKTVHMKSKFTPAPKKYRNTMKQKIQKRLIEVPPSEMKPMKKKANEIDKLLQDEGVVNLLYDVEQPERKRLVPITKSQTKVMDVQKVQRELKIRTKLVRNAVLRLRSSGGSPTKISPRSKRGVTHITTPESENRENERIKSTRSSISSNPDFIIPAKIRNAADASIIVRRHSSSSFSSTSGSPRASIDGPDKQMEASGSEEGPAHVTRSARRRYSQTERNKQFAEVLSTPKKNGVNRKKSTEIVSDVDNTGDIISTEKIAAGSRPNLRTDIKSVIEKTAKNSENIDVRKSSSNPGAANKISTRSNGSPVEKELIKTKKGTKTKAAGSRAKDLEDIEMDVIGDDKLSVCLAEAASALSNVDGSTSQSESTTVKRKLRSPSISPKTDEISPSEILELSREDKVELQRLGYIVQLIFTTSSTKLKNGFTLPIMKELSETLMVLRRDEECRVVILTSTGTSFCEGLDLSDLIHDNKEERRVHAEEIANGLKEFIKILANFNKPIVAGIQGPAVGLGVTMLPLFDLVVASDKATFSTPYGQLGQIPEGAAILTLSQTVGNTVTSELLLGGRTLTASEALRAGLVTRVLWPDRFQGELIPSLRAMSEHSSQAMEATKTLLRHSLRKKLDAALETESYLLIQHWCSAECQTLIKRYLDDKGGH